MKVHVQDGEIAITSHVTRYLLAPDDARQLVLDLQAALFALQEAARKQAREAKAAALWAEWLAAGAVPETTGGLLLLRPMFGGRRWLRPGKVESETPPHNLVFSKPVWCRDNDRSKAHHYTTTGHPACGMGAGFGSMVDPAAVGADLCKACLRRVGAL